MDILHMDTVYRFGGLSLDLARGALLTVGGEVIPLRPKSFALLALFVANAGKLLSRDAINQAIWSDVIVTDDGITQCVRDIRRALGDSTQQMLRTVPRRGFIFSAEVVAESKATNADTAASRDKPSVAVLPFANMSGQPEQEYFSDGVADDIITNLSGSSSLLVTARTSSFAYRGRPFDVKQVAHELGVCYVVEGSVRREADQLRINARLISAEMGTPLWSERYDRTITEVFEVQDEIVAAVTKAIVPAVADAEQPRALRRPPERLGAWESYQRGLWHLSKFSGANLAFAREFFEQAIAIDPTFAAARSHLAMTYIEEGYIYVMRPSGEAITLAAAVAVKALDYDPTDADAQATVAFATMVAGRSERVAERLSHALASNPSSPWVSGVQGVFLVWNGHTREGPTISAYRFAAEPARPVLRVVPAPDCSFVLFRARLHSGCRSCTTGDHAARLLSAALSMAGGLTRSAREIVRGARSAATSQGSLACKF